jgi:two-component system response regulator NreC
MPVRILLADDHLLVREALRDLLAHGGFEVVGQAADGHQAVQLAHTIHFDVALLDIIMPRMNGIEAAREILLIAPHCRIVVLTVLAEERQVAAAFRAGVRGYVNKTQAADELLHAIREVASGGTYMSPQVSTIMLGAYLTGNPIAADRLTSRERQVLQLVAEGKSTKEVADLMGLTAKTAEAYRSRVKAKLQIHDTAGLVRYAIREGIVALSAIWWLNASLSWIA